MHLVTERLRIEPLAEPDIEAFTAYRRDPAIARYQTWETSYSPADAARLIAAQPVTELPAGGDWLQLALHAAADGRLVGDVAVHRLGDEPDTFAIGVTLAPAEHGRGYGTEALTAVIEALFTAHGAHRVVATSDARNDAVHVLLARVGMRQESRQVDADWFKGEWTTLDGFAVLRSEWLRR
jgi:RimJ/RimL family protein N-acetyltransferase